MTSREYFENVKNANISDEMTAASIEFLKKLDAKNEKRKVTPSKEKVAAFARRDAIRNFLITHEGTFTRDQIAEELGFTAGQVSGACKILVDNNEISKTELRVDKARKMGYYVCV